MSSSSTPQATSMLNHPLINRLTTSLARLQEQNIFSKQRLNSFKHHFLITIGFLVILYCSIHIQFLIFWLLKLLIRFIFKIISFIFWLPLKSIRFLMPKTIDYDILFPVFWLCSIASFYISKYYHEKICLFYDQYLVRRYKIFHYDQTKREDIKKYLFISTFIILLLLQTLFILIPIAISIRHQHQHTKVSSTPVIPVKTEKTTVKTPTAKSAVKDVVETMTGNLYKRFINAFKDENETKTNEKRSPLISDEKLEDTFKILKNEVKKLKSTDQQEEKKSSRFQRWIIHYLKAPFQKYEGKKTEEVKPNIEEEENKDQLHSSSSISDSDDSDDEDEDDEDDDDLTEADTTIADKVKQQLKNLAENKISSSKDEDSDEDEDDDDDLTEADTTITDKVKQQLKNLAENKISSSKDEDSDEDEEDSPLLKEHLAKSIDGIKKLSSSIDSDDDESDEDESHEELTRITNKIKDQLSKPIEQVKNIAETVGNQIQNKLSKEDEDSGYDSDDEADEGLTEKIKDTLEEPIEKVKNIASDIKNKISSSSESILKEKLSSSISIDDEDDDDDVEVVSDEEQHPSFYERAQKIVTPIKDKISSTADELKHTASDVVHSAEDFASDMLEKSSEFVAEKTEQIREKLPTKDEFVSTIKHDVIEPLESKASNILEKSSEFVAEKTDQIREKLPTTDEIVSRIKHVMEPLESKASKIKKVIDKEAEHIKDVVTDKLKSLKKKKKPKTLTEKAKDKFKILSKSLQEKLSIYKKKPKPSKLKKFKQKLNGWFDEGWNIWHLAKRKFSRIFIRSTKHARHLPRYKTTSLYTAYTDLKCYDYTKNLKPYRVSKPNKHLYFLDTYRHHSPFPVYLSVLKSNGPRCYRHYPDSSCGILLKTRNRTFIYQLYRFVRFWAIVGIIVVILAVIYKALTHRKQNNSSSYHQHHKDSDRSSTKIHQTTISNQNNDRSTSPTIQKPSSTSSNQNTQPLNEQIEKQLSLWLQHEQNDGFRHLSEICRIAINNTFLKQLERLSIETLQFANAKLRNVSQNKNNTKAGDTSPEKLVINAILDIDHLILNIINTFKEQHFSLETPKLSGQLHILLVINPNQYSIEANLKQLQINPVNIIDPNHALSVDERHSIVKVLDETINRTVVRCSFRLSDIQENINLNTLYNSSPTSYPDANKSYSSSNQLSTSSLQTPATRSRQATPNRYQPSDPLPTVVINDTDRHSYMNESTLETEPKRVLIRIVKAVKLHDVEQPYCILELNHPKQIQQTSIAKNGLNPFWDERFLFECDEHSNQIHLQIIDRKKPTKRNGNYVDTVYADVSIPFSYVTSTVYKQDVQISPQHPESIIRIEFSTLSEEEALAANNGYDIESLTDSQTWTYNEREAAKIEHDYPQRYQHSPTHEYLSSSYDANTLPKHYGLSTSLYDDEHDYSATLPRTADPFSTSSPLVPRNDAFGNDKPQKSKSFMSSLKHLTLPRRKQRSKSKNDNSISSQASSISQLNTSLQSPQTNLVSHSISSALPGPKPEYFMDNLNEPTRPIRRSRSISQSFKNLFRSHSKKKAAKADALGEFENGKHNYVVDNRSYLSTSTPTTKKLSFLQRRKSKQKAKQQTNFSTNSLSSYDCSRLESVRDTPIRANVGHPVTMTKTLV